VFNLAIYTDNKQNNPAVLFNGYQMLFNNKALQLALQGL
jgi:hypothetical protein